MNHDQKNRDIRSYAFPVKIIKLDVTIHYNYLPKLLLVPSLISARTLFLVFNSFVLLFVNKHLSMLLYLLLILKNDFYVYILNTDIMLIKMPLFS
jgi:hypothetical protein